MYICNFADLKMPVMYHWKNTNELKRLEKSKVIVGAFTLNVHLAFSTLFLTLTQLMTMWRYHLMDSMEDLSTVRLVTWMKIWSTWSRIKWKLSKKLHVFQLHYTILRKLAITGLELEIKQFSSKWCHWLFNWLINAAATLKLVFSNNFMQNDKCTFLEDFYRRKLMH